MANKKNKTKSVNFFQDQILGIIALTLAMISLITTSTPLALLAIGFGGLAVWGNVRNHDYEFLFLGITAILVSLVSIWNTASQIIAHAAN